MNIEIAAAAEARALLERSGIEVELTDAPDALTLLLVENGLGRGVLQLESLGFDSRIFGVAMGRIGALKAADESGYVALLRRCQAECTNRGIRHVVRRLAVGDFSETWGLEATEYRLVDVSVLFERDLEAAPAVEGAIRPISADEVEELAVRYADSFVLTRFAVDPFCTREASSELHRQWLLNSCRGRADAVLVGDALEGFVTCRVDPRAQIGNIELIAVDSSQRGAGIGKRLVAAALAWFHTRVRRVQVRTQLNNAVAITLYQASGFRLKLGELTYSRTFGEEQAAE
jgi:ribosomal protein S18 acetylase RimI-like enzyme